MRILGVDEAGRGPVIGPMVMAGVVIQEHQEDDLRSMGVKDSKLLSSESRNVLAHKIEEEVLSIHVVVLTPKEIDVAVMGESNLNRLEAQTTAKIIAESKPDLAVIDCPSTNTTAYALELKRLLPPELRDKVTIKAEHKADARYASVAAASIIAKVRRDSEILKLKGKIGIDFGSGYPSDPLTQEFLKKHYNDYDFFRKSWSTWRVLAETKKQKSLFDF